MDSSVTSNGCAVDRYQSEVRIKSYSNRRRKPENLAMDQRRLEEMNASTPASPLREVCEDNPDITLAEAKQREAGEPPEPQKKEERKKGEKEEVKRKNRSITLTQESIRSGTKSRYAPRNRYKTAPQASVLS